MIAQRKMYLVYLLEVSLRAVVSYFDLMKIVAEESVLNIETRLLTYRRHLLAQAGTRHIVVV